MKRLFSLLSLRQQHPRSGGRQRPLVWLLTAATIAPLLLSSSALAQAPDCNTISGFTATYIGANRGGATQPNQCMNAVYRLQFTVAPFETCNDADPTFVQIRVANPSNPAQSNVVWVTTCRQTQTLAVDMNISVPFYPNTSLGAPAGSGHVNFEFWLMPSVAPATLCSVLNPTPLFVPQVPNTIASPSVLDLTCEVNTNNDVVLAWDIPTFALYTNILVLRSPTDDPLDVTCITIAGDDLMYTEPFPPGGQSQFTYTVIGLLGGNCSTVAGSCTAMPVECTTDSPCFAFFDIDDGVTVPAGQQVEVPVIMNTGGVGNLGMIAFSFGVRHAPAPNPNPDPISDFIDPEGITDLLISMNMAPMAPFPAVQGAALTGLNPAPSFVSVEVTDEGILVGAVMDVSAGNPGVWTPIPVTGPDPANGVEVARLIYNIDSSTPPGTYPLTFAAFPPVQQPNDPTIPLGPAISAIVLKVNPVNMQRPLDVQVAPEDLNMGMGAAFGAGSIMVTEPLFTFFRGDHDGDFRITANDIAIAVDFFDTTPGTTGSADICEKAMDWDNNGFLEAVDLLSHVNYFSGGLVPFPPSENVALGMPQTSATCGTDTGPDNLSCENVTCP